MEKGNKRIVGIVSSGEYIDLDGNICLVDPVSNTLSLEILERLKKDFKTYKKINHGSTKRK